MGGSSFLQRSRTQLKMASIGQRKMASIGQRLHNDPDLILASLLTLGLERQLLTTAAKDITEGFKRCSDYNESSRTLALLPDKDGVSNPGDTYDYVLASGTAFEFMAKGIPKFMSGELVGQGKWKKATTDMSLMINDFILPTVKDILDLASIAGPIGIIISIIGRIILFIIKLILLLQGKREPSVGELINSALQKERMRQNIDFWLGLANEFDTMGGLFRQGTSYDDAKTAWFLVLQHDLAVNRAKVFMKECLSPDDWDQHICTDYIKDGMWELMLVYAEAHMTVLWELAMQFLENPLHDISYRKSQVEAIIKKMIEFGNTYVAALEHAWDVYYPYRMSVIWNPFDKYDMNEYNNIFHPFDFIHARVKRSYDKLDIEYPVKLKDGKWNEGYRADVHNIRNWKYEGCEGERHDDVWRQNDPKTPNHACNLFHMITNTNKTEGCGCNPGSNYDRFYKKWYQTQLSSADKQCWADCMSKFVKEQDRKLKEVFQKRVQTLSSFVEKLSFPETFKIALQTSGTSCGADSTIVAAKCSNAFQAIGEEFLTESKISDKHVPAGCSVRAAAGSSSSTSWSLYGGKELVANEVQEGVGAEGYVPLCGVTFFTQKTSASNRLTHQSTPATSERGSA